MSDVLDPALGDVSSNMLYQSLKDHLFRVNAKRQMAIPHANNNSNETDKKANDATTKRLTVRRTNDTSMLLFESLKNHSALIAEILSYIVEDTKGLADLRKVSKRWNTDVRPHVWRSGPGFRKICAPTASNDKLLYNSCYCEDLVKYGACSYAGQLYNIPTDDNFAFFVKPDTNAVIGREAPAEDEHDSSGQPQPWASTISMLFCCDEEYIDEPRKRVKINLPETGDESSSSSSSSPEYLERETAERFASHCKRIAETNSWDEFQRLVDDAFTEGLFLCVEDRQQLKKSGDGMQLGECGYGFFVPVILTVVIPQGKMVEAAHFGSTMIVYLNAKIQKHHRSGYSMDNAIPFVCSWNNSAMMKEGDGEFLYPTFVGYNAVLRDDGSISCRVPLVILVNDNALSEAIWDWGIADSNLPLDDLWRKSQEQHVREGVAIADDFVPKELHNNLMNQIDLLLERQVVDYHPHSNDTVRDIVHPALYSYVKGVSPLLESEQKFKVATDVLESFALEDNPKVTEEDPNDQEPKDYWGRKYETSAKYQWLPTYFDIGLDGSCTICDYINNLVPRQQHEELYELLGHLFSQALPLIESVYGYCRVVKEKHIRMESHERVDYSYTSVVKPIEEQPISLRGKQLQVVTKIVDYELGPGETYEGVWHVEGMSHEEIVATAIYFIDRDEEIEGGELLFKRAFHKQEASYIFSHVDQVRPRDVEFIIDEGLQPLGQVKTVRGRLLVFPNSHVHKVTELKNASIVTDGGKKKRRIIVFFIINPERRIVSTREVPVQQEYAGGMMTHTEALQHRLALMKERKYTKQDWNVRGIELCEH
ncbi:unnamed protein product [Cylindrotheca closterium]|uniref:DUF4246 domain-containing protein n=1 Tax=Cylindrotheca closterium TaxID=2856 RepID=A0AAD2PXS6_9STRA|nr:unnamed protein product [Cylindrotheca closterium]